MRKSTSRSSKTGDDNVTKAISDVTNIVKISVNLSRTVVTFRLKNVPFQVTFCKLKLLLLFNQKALLVNVSIL